MPANLRRIISIMSKYRSETQEMSYNFNQETRNRGQVSPFFWFLGFQIPDPDLNRRAQHADLIHHKRIFFTRNLRRVHCGRWVGRDRIANCG